MMNRYIIFVILLSAFSFGQEEKVDAGELVSRGMTAYSQGEYAGAVKFFREAFVLRPENTALAYNIACSFALADQPESAVVWLAKAVDMGAYVFDDDEDFKSLRELPEYKALEKLAEEKIREIKDERLLPVISLPESYATVQRLPMVIALHGFGSNPVDFSRSLKGPVTQGGYVLVCPYGVEISGTTSFGWGQDPGLVEKSIKNIITWAKNSLNVDTSRVILLGYSQGGWYSYYLGLNNAGKGVFKGIIAVAGYFPEEADSLLKDRMGVDTKFYSMIGEKDHSYQNNLGAQKTLSKKNIQCRVQSYPELGHAFPPDAEMEIKKALEWIESE